MSFGSKTKETSTSTPVESGEWTGLRDKLVNMAMQNLSSTTDMGGYTAAGIDKINTSADASKMARDNMLAARGLSASPIAGNADVMGETARAGDIASFENTIPLVQRDMASDDWAKSLQLFAQRPIGKSSTGTSETSQSPWGAILGALAGGAGSYFGSRKK
jgi:hypothetical protein